jgi:hypothetical protein
MKEAREMTTEKLVSTVFAAVARKEGGPWGVLSSFNAFDLGQDTARAAAKKAAAYWGPNLFDHEVRAAVVIPKRHPTDSKLNTGQYCDHAMNGGEFEFI